MKSKNRSIRTVDTPRDEHLTKLVTTNLGRSSDARTVVLPATSASYIDWGDGEISVVLDLEQVSSPTKGRWRVIKGLSSKSRELLQNDLNQLSLDLIGSGPDDTSFKPEWIFRGDKLLLSITDLLE